jgi:hypothetical protein
MGDAAFKLGWLLAPFTFTMGDKGATDIVGHAVFDELENCRSSLINCHMVQIQPRIYLVFT